MHTQELPEELIILGNGFDLACGLKSSYTDFFNSYINTDILVLFKDSLEYFKKIKAVSYSSYKDHCNDKIKKFLEKIPNVNFFDILFLLNSTDISNKGNWSDIEFNIELFLNQEWRSNTSSTSLNMQRMTRLVQGKSSNTESEFILTCMKVLDRELKEERLEKKILIELNSFENRFKTYLNTTINEKSDYTDCAIEKLKELCKKPLISELLGDPNWDFKKYTDVNLNKLNILNFNYTNPFKNLNQHKEFIINIQNVHGTLNKEIVFGVDDISIEANNNLYSFTKTSRMMSNSYYSRRATPILHPNIKKIKFYGHSLSEMDYSYFQSIFDFYNLYGSDVQLFFYYSIYDEVIAEDIKSSQLQAITKMIHKYGATMNNKDHGRNLQHKLLLEKRIHMIEI